MLSWKRISIFILIFSIIITIGVGVKAHRIHDVKYPDLSFTSNPTVSCNIDGTTFIRNIRTDGVGKVLSDFWSPEPVDPIVSMTAESHGLGWAHILFYGNIDGEPFGDDTNTHEQRLGTWIGFAPIAYGVNEVNIEASYNGSFNTDPKEYSWDASGSSVTLVPVFWKWRWSGKGIGGSWEETSGKFHDDQTASGGGSWTVIKSVASIPNVTFNKTTFKVYETLEVTVEKTDLYYVAMYIDGEHAASGYAGSDGAIVLSKTFDTGDVGNHTVKLLIYSDGGANSTTDSSTVTVK